MFKINVGGLPLYAVIGAVALAGASGLYMKGRWDGRAAVLAKAQKELAEQLEERGLTNEEVAGMSDADKCELIGGVWNDGECE